MAKDTNAIDQSLSLANPHPSDLSNLQKVALALVGIGLLSLLLALAGKGESNPLVFFLSSVLGISIGSILYTREEYSNSPAGIKNYRAVLNNIGNRGAWGWILGIAITGFYTCLYWFPQHLEGLIRIHDPLSQALRGRAADQWFLYGFFYTMAVLLMGLKFGYKYRHNRYQLLRTGSVMFFQLGFAFLLPAFLIKMNQPEEYFSYFWPLDSYALRPEWVSGKNDGSTIGMITILSGIALPFIATPILTYFYGKRWYCSWVCGCGGLAETAGDPFRQLSDKSLGAWKLERYMIYTVLLVITALTVLLWVNHQTHNELLGKVTDPLKAGYGFVIAQLFSGVIGTGFYPLLGNRAWCRFGCPMAAILGLFQRKASRFRITTNGGQCISCGNCSTYCEMGIDVRAYAQRGQDIVRASCVGCGVCSAVCPRGVLRLENSGEDLRSRAEEQRVIHISVDEVKLL